MDGVTAKGSFGRGALAVALVLALGGWQPMRTQDGDVARGNRAYAEGRWDDAIGAYEAARGSGVDEGGLDYDLGTAKLRKAEETQDATLRAEALAHLDQAAAKAADPKVRSRAAYNRGNARLADDQLAEAIDSYKDALRADPGFDDARTNLELAMRKRQKQQQQQQQQGQGQGQGQPQQGQGQGQPQQGQGQGDPQQGQGQGQPQQGQGQGDPQQGQGDPQPGQGDPQPGQGDPQPGQGDPQPGQDSPSDPGQGQGSGGQDPPRDPQQGQGQGSGAPDPAQQDPQQGQGQGQGQDPADAPPAPPFDPAQRPKGPTESPRTPQEDKLRSLEQEARRLRREQMRGRARDTSRMPSGQDW